MLKTPEEGLKTFLGPKFCTTIGLVNVLLPRALQAMALRWHDSYGNWLNYKVTGYMPQLFGTGGTALTLN
jgi:hypothetical protein